MKRLLFFLVLVAGLMLAAVPMVAAQTGAELISLDNSTPGIDIVVASQPGASGALALELSGASVRVTDSAGQTVFTMADKRARQLELRFGPEATTHTVTVERLPGIQQAYVRATPQDDLTTVADFALVNQAALAPGQGVEALVGVSAASSAIHFTVPDGQPARLVASFSGAQLAGQIDDAAGVAVARLSASLIDGLSITLDGGQYSVDMASSDTSIDALTITSLTAAASSSLPEAVVMSAAPTPQPEVVAQPAAPAAACSIQIASAVEVHTGPGVSYSLMGYAPRGITLLVGGISRQQDWILVGDGQVSGWVQGVPGQVTGDCTLVPTVDVPAPQANTAPAGPSQTTSNPVPAGEHEENEHESGDGD
ncbi:MAG TPA: hypothetical protein VER79_08460 [Candidatus Limnocylindrales bacterium]|nr:hypothetical protein [Candidatus Limnocylindrales bacterium]